MQKEILFQLCDQKVSSIDLKILNKFLLSLQKQHRNFYIFQIKRIVFIELFLLLFFCFILKDFSFSVFKAAGPFMIMIAFAYSIMFLTKEVSYRKEISFLRTAMADYTQTFFVCPTEYVYLGSTKERLGNDNSSSLLHSVRFMPKNQPGARIFSFGKNDRHFIYDILIEKNIYKFYKVNNKYILIVDAAEK